MRARTFVVALLAVILVVSDGCGGGGGKKDSGDSLTFWTAEDNPDRVKATQAILDRFQQQTNITVKLVAIGENQLPSQLASASAAGPYPTCSLPRRSALCTPRRPTASSIPTRPPPSSTPSVARPSPARAQPGGGERRAGGHPQRQLDPAAGLPQGPVRQGRPGRAHHLPDDPGGGRQLTGEGMAGIVAATKPDSFTQQTFEYLAVANNCQLVDRAGTITLTSKPCLDTFQFYRSDPFKVGPGAGRHQRPGRLPGGHGGHDHLVVVSARRAQLD